MATQQWGILETKYKEKMLNLQWKSTVDNTLVTQSAKLILKIIRYSYTFCLWYDALRKAHHNFLLKMNSLNLIMRAHHINTN